MNNKEISSVEGKRTRSTIVTIVLNLVFPGFGYLYLGQIQRALIILGVLFTFNVVAALYLGLSFLGFAIGALFQVGLYLYVLADSFQKTRRGQVFPQHPIQRKRILIPLFIVCTMLTFFLNQVRRIESYVVPSVAMCPSVHIGDRLVIDKKAPLARGGIYVHASPQNLEINFVKRLIGLPGDKIAIQNGDLMLNGKPVIISKRPIGDTLRDGCSAEILKAEDSSLQEDSQIYEAQIDDQKVSFLVINPSMWMDFSETVIPEGQYFFIGDNLNRSHDSRIYGPVEAKHLKGKALYAYFSNHAGQAFWNRMGHRYLSQ